MEFLNINVFYMLPILLLFLLFKSKSGMQEYFSEDILNTLRVGNKYLSQKSRNILYFFVLILFIIALARPVIDQKEQDIEQNLIPIVIALDVSTSMKASDIYPNRISLAKKKLQNIISKAKNATIGVVLFANDSFVLSPVTEDFLSLQYIVDNLDTNLDFVNGSNIYSTLEATKYMLEDYSVKNVIVLSDGGNNNDYDEELDFTKENNIVIYSIGMASKEGAPIPKENGYVTNVNGDIVTVKLNESIKNLSLKSGGGYIDFTLDGTDVDAILSRINAQSKKEQLTTQKIKVYTELFYYPLGLALFFLLLSISSFPKDMGKKNLSILFILVCISMSSPIKSFSYSFDFEKIEQADTAYKNKDFKTAASKYKEIKNSNESLYNLGNSLYKEKKFQEAIDIYNKINTDDKSLESKKLHNLGNSFVNINNLEKAKEFYEKSLEISKNKETKENLELVNKELEKKKKEKEQKKNQDKNEEQNDKDEKKENQEQKDKENKENKEQQNNKSKQNEKEKKDQKSKEENKKEENKSKEQSTDEKSQKEDKQKKDEQKEENKSKEQQSSQGKVKKDEISDMEEKKWMKMLQKQQAPIYLQKIQSDKGSNYDEKQPW